jgi:hypothetical protein
VFWRNILPPLSGLTCVPSSKRDDRCRLDSSTIIMLNKSKTVFINFKRTVSGLRVGGFGFRHVEDILTKSFYHKHLVRKMSDRGTTTYVSSTFDVFICNEMFRYHSLILKPPNVAILSPAYETIYKRSANRFVCVCALARTRPALLCVHNRRICMLLRTT